MVAVRNKRRIGLLAAALIVAVLPGCGGDGEEPRAGSTDQATGDFDAESYFRGKTIRLVITQSVGGGTDVASRFMASHLSDFVPGKPSINVTNLQDTAGMNRVYNAPADQLIIGATSNGQSLYTSAEEEGAEHDAQKARIVGAVAPSARGYFLSESLGYDNLGDAVGSDETLRFAGAIGGADDIQDDQMLSSWLCDNLKLNCKMIQVADDDSATLNLMLERGEINIDSGGLISRLRNLGDGLESGKYVMGAIFDAGEGAVDVELPEGVELPPDVSEILPADLQDDYEQILPVSGSGGLGTVLWAGPAIEEDVLEALRQGMADLMADEAVLADFADLQQAEVGFIPGAEGEATVREFAGVFADNADLYSQLREKYWEKYWSG